MAVVSGRRAVEGLTESCQVATPWGLVKFDGHYRTFADIRPLAPFVGSEVFRLADRLASGGLPPPGAPKFDRHRETFCDTWPVSLFDGSEVFR